jgi:hypothetical protein
MIVGSSPAKRGISDLPCQHAAVGVPFMNHVARGLVVSGFGALLMLSPFVSAHWVGDPFVSNMPQPESPTRPAPNEPEPPPPPIEDYTVDFRKLTSKEINRVRYMELRGMRMRTDLPDRVTVKISKETVDDFLVAMEGNEDFKGEASRREFRKLMPPQKLHQIATYMKEPYADKVEILTDPEVFVEFKKNVMPQVLRGCATTGCHAPGSGDAVKFRLFKDPKKTAETTYANFLILNDVGIGQQRVINRAQVSDSLLLTYMLPPEDVKPELRHPGKSMGKPIFRGRGALQYKRLEHWISSLKNPPSDYGVYLVKPIDDLTQGMVPASSQPVP